jgi:hypothetical protein
MAETAVTRASFDRVRWGTGNFIRCLVDQAIKALFASLMIGFVGALGILFGAWSIKQLKHFLLR